MQPNLIDHLAAFIAIAEASSISDGARRLNCSVSTASYTLAKLEQECGFPLLKRGGRNAELTPRGQALLREARTIVESARIFAAHAASLRRGEESHLRMAIDIMFHHPALTDILSDFADRHPHAMLQLFSTSLNTLWEQLQSGAIDFGIVPLCDVPSDIEGRPFSSVELIPIAASDHPLAGAKNLKITDLRRHRQLCYAGSANAKPELKSQIFGSEVWTCDDVGVLRAMVKKGIGWVLATAHFFREEFNACQVTEIDCGDARLHASCPVGFVWHIDRPPGPLGNELLKSFVKNYSPPLDLTVDAGSR